MLFNSNTFILFLPVVFVGYWLIQQRGTTIQNLFILLSSYIFYGWWDYRFLTLIIISSLVDYIVGRGFLKYSDPKIRKRLFLISLFVNLSLLGFFKYFNFFLDSFVQIMLTLGLKPHITSLRIILPVGISFYTFQTLSYTIDAYRKQIQPIKDPIAFFAFVSFFPQLVAGPIERAKNLLPQFQKPRIFDVEKAVDGIRQILWGYFKKVVVADNLAIQVDTVFSNINDTNPVSLMIGIFFFTIQIYCDFSGYSDIAIGVARLFGLNLSRNFAYPFFARTIADFWRQWHISLSTWFRDYIYFPLGGNRVSNILQVRNILITFTISGLWHGADWTFIVFGFVNGLYYIPLIYRKKQKKAKDTVASGRIFPSLSELLLMMYTFSQFMFSLIFFRAASLRDAVLFFKGFLCNWRLPLSLDFDLIIPFVSIAVLLSVEWLQRTKQHGFDISRFHIFYRWLFYYLIFAAYFFLAQTDEIPFYYFQF